MIVTRNWLQEFVDCTLEPADLAHRLTMSGLEVEGVEELGAGLDSVIVARLDEVGAHPDADRLTLCKVNTGQDLFDVVCGATNHKQGDLVAFAQVGSVLPGDFKIKKSKIRGQVSLGMLCSEKELGLASESDGIMILPAGLELGRPVFDALGLKDLRLEIGLTPNRPDCLSILGVAREVSALCGSPLQQSRAVVVESGGAIDEETSVTIEDAEFCPRYGARLIKGIKVGPSPQWLAQRLEAVGIRSINNVVDVTNLVMIELGHPLHAFDFNLLREKKIVVKRATEGELFHTLDGQERALKGADLVICDGEGPVALAGIMGGQNSEIQDDTSDVLLEAAYFEPTAVRRTSKRLGIHSESSHRFERGADVDMVPGALDRAASLILELAGGSVCKGMIDNFARPLKPRRISLTRNKTEAILGLSIELVEMQRLLRSIQLEVETASDREDEVLYVTVPTFRPDLEREIDLIEEVARLNGYDRIPTTMPASRLICHLPDNRQRLVSDCRNKMVALGFHEVVNYSFVSPVESDKLLLPDEDPRRQQVALQNPLNEEQSVMRTTLVGSLLSSLAGNIAYRSTDLALFELRPVFAWTDDERPARESYRLVAALTGRRDPVGWAQSEALIDFFDLKGVAEELLSGLALDDLEWATDAQQPYLHPGKSCRISAGESALGEIGELHPKVLDQYGIEQPVFLLDLDMEGILAGQTGQRKFSAISRFPDLFRDSAILVDEDLTSEEVLEVVDKARGATAEETILFDVYRGKGVPEGKKSLAFRVRYRAADRTLTDEEVNKAHGRIVRALEHKLSAQLR